MIEQDTINLLRECDSGIKMGISSIDDVLKYVKSEDLKDKLLKSKNEHSGLEKEVDELLQKYNSSEKNPNPLVKTMSKMKTAMKIGINESDKAIADLMTDGCNMGIKSLSKYLNQYAAADEFSKDVAKRLITLEETLAKNMRDYL